MGAMDTISTRMAGVYRADILGYASDLLSPQDRGDSAAVTRTAAPLLEWAERAHDCNDPALQRLTPAEFLDHARIYHVFITESAA